ncbi:MAG: hypothetical protein ACJA0Y_000498 [Maricaulis maris]|jgi:hypothetical protein
MNILKAKALGRWLAKQLGEMPGGYEAACAWPDSPMKSDRLSAIGRGERPWPFNEGLVLLALNDRSDLLRAVADLIDSQEGVGSIAKLAHSDVYASADLARTVDAAEEDGRLTHAEIIGIRKAAAVNLQHATELAARAERLHAGEIED